MRSKLLLQCLTIGFLSCMVCGAHSARAADTEPYPARAIRLIIPFPPGGSNDVVGRVLAAQLGERLGRTVVVDNRGGAGGVIGSEIASKSDPDGYTLLFISAAFPSSVSMYKLPYDPVKSFVPVAIIAAGVRVIRIVSEPPVSGGSTDSRAGSAALAHGAAVPARARARRAAR